MNGRCREHISVSVITPVITRTVNAPFILQRVGDVTYHHITRVCVCVILIIRKLLDDYYRNNKVLISLRSPRTHV